MAVLDSPENKRIVEKTQARLHVKDTSIPAFLLYLEKSVSDPI